MAEHDEQKKREWNIINPQKREELAIQRVRYVLAGIFAVAGIVLLISQLFPLAGSFLLGVIPDLKDSLRINPIPDEYKEQLETTQIYDPGQSYFQNLLSQSGLEYQGESYSYDPVTHSLRQIIIDESYSTPMKMDIESVEISSLRVSPNVNSYDKNIYNVSLKYGVAHFKGTPLPGDGGNSFIYGHSTVTSFLNSSPDNPEIAFSKLENVEVGDKVKITKDEKELLYTVQKIKKVEPDDFSILKSQDQKETVTLMTCWPLGLGTKRLVVIAERDE